MFLHWVLSNKNIFKQTHLTPKGNFDKNYHSESNSNEGGLPILQIFRSGVSPSDAV